MKANWKWAQQNEIRRLAEEHYIERRDSVEARERILLEHIDSLNKRLDDVERLRNTLRAYMEKQDGPVRYGQEGAHVMPCDMHVGLPVERKLQPMTREQLDRAATNAAARNPLKETLEAISKWAKGGRS